MNTASGTNVSFLKLPTTLNTTASAVWVASPPKECAPKPRVLVIDAQSSFCELLSLYLPQQDLDVATCGQRMRQRSSLSEDSLTSCC